MQNATFRPAEWTLSFLWSLVLFAVGIYKSEDEGMKQKKLCLSFCPMGSFLGMTMFNRQ